MLAAPCDLGKPFRRDPAEASMLGIATVMADVVGRSRLGRDVDAKDLDFEVHAADDEGMCDEGSKCSAGPWCVLGGCGGRR
jgi:hypothetical protein